MPCLFQFWANYCACSASLCNSGGQGVTELMQCVTHSVSVRLDAQSASHFRRSHGARAADVFVAGWQHRRVGGRRRDAASLEVLPVRPGQEEERRPCGGGGGGVSRRRRVAQEQHPVAHDAAGREAEDRPASYVTHHPDETRCALRHLVSRDATRRTVGEK